MRTPLALTCVCALLTTCGLIETQSGSSGGGGSVQSAGAPRVERAPIMGGGLLVMGGGRFAAFADADRSTVWVVDLEQHKVRGHINVPAGSWPNRMAEDARGNLRVALRRSGELATLSITSMEVKSREPVCTEPRGVAWSARLNATIVACASGELVTVPMTGESTTRVIERDLRDVVVLGDRVFVTTFREGKVLEVTGSNVLQVTRVPGDNNSFVGGVAWQAIAFDGKLAISHQRSREGEVLGMPSTTSGSTPAPSTGAYGASPGGFPQCGTSPVVRSAVSLIDTNGALLSTTDVGGSLPVSLAIRPGVISVAVAGTGGVESSFACPRPQQTESTVVDVAATPAGELITVSLEPALTMTVGGKAITLAAGTRNEGFSMFHTVTPSGVSCASCHPEGGDDGRVWTFDGKAHRTQVLTGGLLDTAPFHWEGTFRNLGAVMDDTFVARMGGVKPSASSLKALEGWLQELPAPRARPAPLDQLTRGRALFIQAGCATCHSGPHYTNDQTMDVGTHGSFQVPSLNGVAARTPLMHDGCAHSVRERFNPRCSGTAHGDVSGLSSAELDDLTAFVESL